MKSFVLATVSIALIQVSTPARALNVREYYQAKAVSGFEWIAAQRYIQGFAHGVLYTSIYEDRQFHTPIICQPETLNVNIENLIDILERQIKTSNADASASIESNLLLGLKSTFPCGNSSGK